MRFLCSVPTQVDCSFNAVSSSLATPRDNLTTKDKKGRPKTVLSNGNLSEITFVGTSRSLEKPYFRLTTFPKAEYVYPLSVLKKAFDFTKEKYRENEDFSWANEQLKILLQDLMVQGLRNDFVL